DGRTDRCAAQPIAFLRCFDKARLVVLIRACPARMLRITSGVYQRQKITDLVVPVAFLVRPQCVAVAGMIEPRPKALIRAVRSGRVELAAGQAEVLPTLREDQSIDWVVGVVGARLDLLVPKKQWLLCIIADECDVARWVVRVLPVLN